MIAAGKRNAAIAVGVTIWFVAAMIVHFLPGWFDGGTITALLFAGAIVSSWLTVDLVRLLFRPAVGEIAPMMAWGTLSALMLDGLGIAFFPALYAGVSPATQFGAAFIMWAAGLGLLFGLVRDR